MKNLLTPDYNIGARQGADIQTDLPVRSLDEIRRRIADIVVKGGKSGISLLLDIWTDSATVTIPAGVSLDIVGNNFKTDILWVVQAGADLNVSSVVFTNPISGAGRIVISDSTFAEPAFTGDLAAVTTNSCVFQTTITTGEMQNCEIKGLVGDSDSVAICGAITDSRIDLVGGLSSPSTPIDSRIDLTGDWVSLNPGIDCNIFARNFTSVASPPATIVADGDYGDITVSGTGTVWTIDNDVVTFAKMQNIPTDTLIGRDTAGTGDPETITLNATLSMTGAGALQRAALTGDVTATAGSNATTIANLAVTTAKIADNAVTFPKIQDIPTDTLIGRDTAGSGDLESITLGASLSMSGAQVLQRAALTGDVTAAVNSNATTIANNAVTNAKLRDSTALSVIGNPTNATADPLDIVAFTDGDILRRNGTTIGFGTIPESSVINLVTDLAARLTNSSLSVADNHIARFDGTTGKIVQDSLLTISDTGLLSGLLAPSSGSDATNKTYVDAQIAAASAALLSNAAAQTVNDTGNTSGVGPLAAREDHSHLHGNLSSPTLHAVATTLANGFMSGADKLKLDSGFMLTDGDKGDITVSVSGAVWAIDNGAVDSFKLATDAVTTAKILNANVTLSKIQDIASNSLLGRATAGSGVTEVININSTLGLSGGALQRSALTGDVTAPAGSNATTISALAVQTGMIANNAVTNGKLRTSVALSVIGNNTNATSNPADIVALADGDVLRRSGTTLGFGLIPESSVTNLVVDLAARVVGPTPATSTDNAVTRWDGTTGRLIQNSIATLTDNGLFRAADGGIDGPTYSFTAETGLGWYRNSNNIIGLAAAGSGIGLWGIANDGLSGLDLVQLQGPSIIAINGAAADFGNRYAWASDADTFITNFGGNRLQTYIGGSIGLDHQNTGAALTARFGGNSTSIPSISFVSDSDTGLGISTGTANNLLFFANGLIPGRVTPNGFQADPNALSSVPSYTWDGDTDTGFNNTFANSIDIVLGGVPVVQMNSTYFLESTNTLKMGLANGTAATPTYSFSGDLNTGMYRSASDTIGWSTNGLPAMTLDGNNTLTVSGNIAGETIGTFVADANTIFDATVGWNATWTSSFTGTRQLQVTNMTPGKRVVVYVTNNNATARSIQVTYNSGAAASGVARPISGSAGIGAVPATSVTLAGSGGAATFTIERTGAVTFIQVS